MEEIEKTLKSLSDDEKIDKLKEESRYTYIRMLIMSLNSDELKLQMIDKLKDSHKAELIESMQSDDLKMQSLSFFDNYKQEIIISMKSDEKKIEAMKKYIESSSQCREIIESLSLPENKIANLYLLDTPYDIQKVLKNIKIENDEQRLKVAQSVKNEYIATDFIKAITDEKIRIQALNTLTDDFSKVKIINTLQDEDKKIEELEKLNNERAKAIIIRNLQDEDKKMEAIEKITDEAIKVDIIINLQNEDKKIEAIEKITDELTKSSIIESLQDEDKKKQEMEKLTNEHAKAKIISSLKDENKKIEELGKITNEYAKVEIINSIKNEDKKKEEIGKLNDELAKAICTELTQNNEGKIPLEKALKNLLEENRNYSEIGLDKNLTIGIEIESEGEMSKIIHKIGDINNKQASGKTSTWKAIPDESLREGEGVEVVSPILTDNKEDVEEIYSICTMLQKCGQSISENCGGHVHIGADYLTSKEAYINLFEIWGNTEKIIYKMSNEKGTIPRIDLETYASSISEKFNNAIERDTINLEDEEDLDHFISEIQDVQESRYSGLNLLNINNGKNTIEFRISNGTINPDVWVENIKLYGRIIESSQKLAEIEKKPEKSKEDKELLELKDSLKEEIPEQEKMEKLLELLFSEEERKIYRERYISTSELLKDIPNEQNPFKESKFSRVDFKSKKHTLDEFYDVAVKDRIEATNEVTRETMQGVKTENELEQVYDENMEEK